VLTIPFPDVSSTVAADLFDVFSRAQREKMRPLYVDSALSPAVDAVTRYNTFNRMADAITLMRPREDEAVVAFHDAFLRAQLPGDVAFSIFAKATVANAAGNAHASLGRQQESLACHVAAGAMADSLPESPWRTFLSVDAQAMQAKRLARLGRIDEAIDKVRVLCARKDRPTIAWIHHRCWDAAATLGWVLLEQKPDRAQEAASWANEALSMPPFVPTPWTPYFRVQLLNVVGKAAHRQDQLDLAHATWSQVLAFAKPHIENADEKTHVAWALLQGIWVGFERKRTEDMQRFLDALALLGTIDPATENEAMVLRGEMCVLKGKLDDAASLALRVDDSVSSVRCALLRLQARIAFARGDKAAGVRFAQTVITEFEHNADHGSCVVVARALLDA
jgi:hypothetical protein